MEESDSTESWREHSPPSLRRASDGADGTGADDVRAENVMPWSAPPSPYGLYFPGEADSDSESIPIPLTPGRDLEPLVPLVFLELSPRSPLADGELDVPTEEGASTGRLSPTEEVQLEEERSALSGEQLLKDVKKGSEVQDVKDWTEEEKLEGDRKEFHEMSRREDEKVKRVKETIREKKEKPEWEKTAKGRSEKRIKKRKKDSQLISRDKEKFYHESDGGENVREIEEDNRPRERKEMITKETADEETISQSNEQLDRRSSPQLRQKSLSQEEEEEEGVEEEKEEEGEEEIKEIDGEDKAMEEEKKKAGRKVDVIERKPKEEDAEEENKERDVFETDGDEKERRGENEESRGKSEEKKREEIKEDERSGLKKRWKAVKDDPTDFSAWTHLLDYVERKNDLHAARSVFDAFFKRYPYCYGYWKKYADFERNHGRLQKAKEVFERGVEAIPLSIDLWLHYLDFFVGDLCDGGPEDATNIRRLYERALTSAGLEFRSDKLWRGFIAWETRVGEPRRAFRLFVRLLAVPTRSCRKNFDKLKDFLFAHDPKDLLEKEEYETLARRMRERRKGRERRRREEERERRKEKEEKREEAEELEISGEDREKAREKILASKESLFKATELEVSKRWDFEGGIKRPYFHVKPLEENELNNWRKYLDFEIATFSASASSSAAFDRVVVLFERCVIACALYEEMWLKYIFFLKSRSSEAARSIFRRACLIHLQNKPRVHIEWAAFEEDRGDPTMAAKILSNIRSTFPDLLSLSIRLASVHRRCGDLDEVERVFEAALSDAKTPNAVAFLAVKYARFLSRRRRKFHKAREVLTSAISSDRKNVRLRLQLLEVEADGCDDDDDDWDMRVLDIFYSLLDNETDEEMKMRYSQHRLEFLEDHGTKIETVMRMQNEHRLLAETFAAKRVAASAADDDDSSSKRLRTAEAVPAAVWGGPGSVAVWTQPQQGPQPPPQPVWNGQQWQWPGSAGYGYCYGAGSLAVLR